MKKSLLLLALCAALGMTARAQDNGGKVLTGPVSLENILDLPGWFGAEFINYKPDQSVMDVLPGHLRGADIVVVLGTWCDDSKREVPKLYRILQMIRDFDPSHITMIGVDQNKVSPGGEQARWNITKVPTIILLKEGKELGRIEEAPMGLLERDMLGLLKGIDPKAPVPPPPPKPTGQRATISTDGYTTPEGVIVPPHPLPPGVPDPLRPDQPAPAGSVAPDGSVVTPSDAPPAGTVTAPSDVPPAGAAPPPTDAQAKKAPKRGKKK
jgi:hypothetical protein